MKFITNFMKCIGMSEGRVRKWYFKNIDFKNRCTNVHDEIRSGLSSLVIKNLWMKTLKKIVSIVVLRLLNVQNITS